MRLIHVVHMVVRKNAVLKKIEGKQAIFALENGEEFRILKEELHNPQENQAYVVQILPQAEAVLERDALAKTLLNQILNEENSSTIRENN